MAAGAAAAQARAETGNQAAGNQHRHARVDHQRGATRQRGIGERTDNQPGKEQQPPCGVALLGRQQAAEDTGDTGDAAVQHQQQRRRAAD